MKSVSRIAFAGTFDPVTEGHLWVVNEALSLADEVIVFVAENAGKSPMFNIHERTKIFEDALAEKGWSDRVQVITLRNAYVARAARKYGAEYLIRGIRSTVDFDYENELQKSNTDVLDGAKTIFVMPPRELASISSSYIKSYIGPSGWHWYVSRFLPESSYKNLIFKRLKFLWDTYVTPELCFVSKTSDEVFTSLIKKYEEPGRLYHNTNHLMHMLDELYSHPKFDTEFAPFKNKLIAAGFIHDVIQGGKNDVAESVEWIKSSATVSDTVTSLVMATEHKKPPSNPLEAAFVSADLSILGQDEIKYDVYTFNVRQEYMKLHPGLTKEAFDAGRKGVLDYFIKLAESNNLFKDEHFAFMYNQQAIENLYRELADLGS